MTLRKEIPGFALGYTTIPGAPPVVNTVIGQVDLSTIGDSDGMFVFRYNILGYRVASTTPYPIYYERQVLITRVSSTYSTPEVLAGADDLADLGFITRQGNANQATFSFDMSGSNLRLLGTTGNANATKAIAYVQGWLIHPA